MKTFARLSILFLAFGSVLSTSIVTLAAQPLVAEGQLTCVFHDLVKSEPCPVFATGRALEFLAMGDDAVIFVESEKKSANVKPDRTSLVASSRVEDSVLMDEIDENEGMLLEREVQELSGARYELPSSRHEIKKQLGLPESAEIAREDWAEMIRVHAETVLSISAVASKFLLEQMGLVAALSPAVETGPPLELDLGIAAPGGSAPVVIETH